MRCEKCRKEITGIGKPAISPALPALLVWGGVIWAMWSLTLGENPLPTWTPTTGWAVGLGTLVAVTVLGWFALKRRKCPECGSTRMLQAMEEESVLATERQMAKEQAAGGLSAGAEAELRQSMGRAMRAEVEAELRAASAKEMAESRVRLEKQLRDEIGQQLRAGQAESEKGLQQRLASELRPEIEKELRPRLEEKLRPEIERELRPRLEEKLRPEIEKELQPRLEEKLRPEIEKELRPRLEEKLRPEIERELRASLKKEASVEPGKTSPPVVESAAKASPEEAKEAGKPAAGSTLILGTHPPTSLPGLPAATGRTAPPRSTPAPMTKTPVVEVSKAAKAETAALPAAKGERALPRIPQATPTPVAVGSVPGISSKAASSLTPAPVSVKAPAPMVTKGAGLTPSPSPGRLAVTPGPFAMDPHERAERRARVIVSDLSLYHKDVLAKAAQAADAKQELGTLWRDAVLAYDRTVPLDVRNTTHYLEEELERHLAKLRQSQASPQHG